MSRIKSIALLLLFLPMLFASCTSYKIMPKEYRNVAVKTDKQKAYVINKDSLSKEFTILKRAEIFELSDDPATPLKIQLYPMRLPWRCGTGYLEVIILTAGQLPLRDRYDATFAFDEIKDDTAVKKQFDVKIKETFWFWNMFAFNQGRNKKIAKGLRGYYYAQQ